MKNLILAFLFIPFLSFGQLSKNEKKSIDAYAVEMCGCVNDLMGNLHPKTIEVILMLAEDEEAGLEELRRMIATMSLEEQEDFLDSFTKMESEEFLNQIEDCDKSSELATELKSQIDNAMGNAHDYLLEVLTAELACETLKALYDMGVEADQ